jgi:hypothetical protein
VPHWEARRLVGSITPKIISTASTIAGLACIEFIKVRGISDSIFIATNNFQVQLGYTKLVQLSNNNVNLNTAVFHESEPLSPKIKRYWDKTFTTWDKIEIHDSKMTIQGLLDYFTTLGVAVDVIGAGNALIHANFRPVAGNLEKQ